MAVSPEKPLLRCKNPRCGYKAHYEHLRYVIGRIWERTQLVVVGEDLSLAIAHILKDEGLMTKECRDMLAPLPRKKKR